MKIKSPVLLVRTTTNRVSDKLTSYLKDLGINPKTVLIKVISQTGLIETPVFVETVKLNTGTTVIIRSQITKDIEREAVKTGNDIILLYNNGIGWKHTHYANGMKTFGFKKMKNRTAAGIFA